MTIGFSTTMKCQDKDLTLIHPLINRKQINMRAFMETLIFGGITFISGSVIMYIINNYFIANLIDGFTSVQFNRYPKLAKIYSVIYPDNEYPPETVEVEKQFGSRIKGVGKVDNEKIEFIFKGHISPTRYITYQFKNSDVNQHDFGVGFLRLSDDCNSAVGHVLYISEGSNTPIEPIRVNLLKKL